MKSKEELTALKEEVNNLNEKLSALTDEEMEQVTGGVGNSIGVIFKRIDPTDQQIVASYNDADMAKE